MFKQLASLLLIILVIFSTNSANARVKKKKTKLHIQKSHSKKGSKHSRKSRRFHKGNGPDLKAITKDSPYTEEPSNGVTPVETKQPAQ